MCSASRSQAPPRTARRRRARIGYRRHGCELGCTGGIGGPASAGPLTARAIGCTLGGPRFNGRCYSMKLKGRGSEPWHRGYPPAPKGRTLYVVGDIHGRLDLLEKVHRDIDDDKASHHAGATQAVEVYLGDYIDRG